MQTSTARGARGPLASLVSVLLVASIPGLACGANAVGPTDSGIQGRVLRGPVAPGPQAEGEAGEEPFSALFHVMNGEGTEVAQFQSDEQGRFRVVLSAGEYTVVPDVSAPIFRAERQRRSVAAPNEGFAEVTLRFDTGLR